MVDKICYPFLVIRNSTIYFAHQYAKQALVDHLGLGVSATHAEMDGSPSDKPERFNIQNAVLFCPDGTAEGVKDRLVQRDLRWISHAYSSGRE